MSRTDTSGTIHSLAVVRIMDRGGTIGIKSLLVKKEGPEQTAKATQGDRVNP